MGTRGHAACRTAAAAQRRSGDHIREWGRARRVASKGQSNVQLPTELARRAHNAGLYTREAGLNLDFHAIRHHGEQVPLQEHYVPARSQCTRSVLTFFAQDLASTDMVYANADIAKVELDREVIAFADYWQNVAGIDPGLCASTPN